MNREKIFYFAVVLAGIVICTIGYSNYLEKSAALVKQKEKSESPTEEDYETVKFKSKKQKEETVTVYIVGEINEPDIYTMPKGSRVADLIKVAGGATDNADISKINLARILNDEDKIDVPSYDEDISEEEKASTSNDEGEVVVNINTASKEELKTIPHVGDVIADKIIYYREKPGGFKQKSELKNVPRIGDKLYNDIEDNICIN
ncbi:MAG: ComEA family DNA-binding protein [Firmicutes bacterium]|nr:ComEA family DNA-binding protein [Bacillota bacterium]